MASALLIMGIALIVAAYWVSAQQAPQKRAIAVRIERDRRE